MNERKIYNVFPEESLGWRVERVDAPLIKVPFPTEALAIRETQRFAAAHPPSAVRIHDYGGRLIGEFEYN